MTREQFAAKIRWSAIAWCVCIVGIFTMMPQLVQIITTHQVRDLNLTMFVICFVSQIAYGMQGFFRRDKMLLVCMVLASLITLGIVILIIVYR